MDSPWWGRFVYRGFNDRRRIHAADLVAKATLTNWTVRQHPTRSRWCRSPRTKFFFGVQVEARMRRSAPARSEGAEIRGVKTGGGHVAFMSRPAAFFIPARNPASLRERR